jgi:ubiquinone/menaquinone biosynthesis C-methylase UbiE
MHKPSWGHEVIEYRKWKGNEIVLDAGCGSGRLTKILSIKVPQGKVIPVDYDMSMIRLAKENLEKISNIEFIKMDISKIKLAEKSRCCIFKCRITLDSKS